jgi:hypothetical protein
LGHGQWKKQFPSISTAVQKNGRMRNPLVITWRDREAGRPPAATIDGATRSIPTTEGLSMARERLHPALIALTCFAALQPGSDGQLLALMLRNGVRNDLSPAMRRHLRLLAQAAERIDKGKRDAMAEQATELAEQIAREVAQGVDDQTDREE